MACSQGGKQLLLQTPSLCFSHTHTRLRNVTRGPPAPWGGSSSPPPRGMQQRAEIQVTQEQDEEVGRGEKGREIETQPLFSSSQLLFHWSSTIYQTRRRRRPRAQIFSFWNAPPPLPYPEPISRVSFDSGKRFHGTFSRGNITPPTQPTIQFLRQFNLVKAPCEHQGHSDYRIEISVNRRTSFFLKGPNWISPRAAYLDQRERGTAKLFHFRRRQRFLSFGV